MTEIEKSKEVLRELTKLSKTSLLSINELRVILALERIVARIESHKTLREKLIFKGGFVLLKMLESPRFTRDLDALAFDLPKQEVIDSITNVLSVDLNDGLYFGYPEIDNLLDQGQYGGYRVKVPFQIGSLPTQEHKLKKLSRVHLDIGFGDVVTGEAIRSALPSLINTEQPVSWKVYPIESIYAEKLETLVSRGSGNSRSKDLYDLVMIFKESLKTRALVAAIHQTFTNRGTAIPDSFAAFFEQLDFTILNNSWGSVHLSGGEMTIEDCKQRLRVVLRDVDLLLQEKY